MKVKEIKNSTYIYHPNSKGTSTNVRCIPKKKCYGKQMSFMILTLHNGMQVSIWL